MPIKQAAFKALRQSRKRHDANRAHKDNLKDLIKKVRKLIAQKKQQEAIVALRAAVKAVDKAAQKGVTKKNAAARIKSRLTRQVNALKKT